jgi:2-oxo-4-hydroxy-4-carboxy-5-ureidoimidazoline decarboxylase
MAQPDEPDVQRLNALSEQEARERLAACLPVARWVEEVATGRPYAAWRDAEERATTAAAELDDSELQAALAGHPRIGERASGPEHQAEHSAREQAAVDPSDARVARALAEGNAAYERRFDRVFIIRAAGRSADEILAELTRRLGNDDATERVETVRQLREIALLRLRQVAG